MVSTAGRDYAALPLSVWLVGQEGAGTQRGQRYSAKSVEAHSGKMLPALARRLLEGYTRPGELVLDPMSGIGTTGVEAVHLGRQYLGVELEERFVRLQRGNLDRARRAGAPGRFEVLHGDARELARVVSGRLADAVIVSPPYGERLRWDRGLGSRPFRELVRSGRFGRGALPRPYGQTATNLGRVEPSDFDAGMHRVWRSCFAVLRPGGLLLVVIQPTRRGRLLDPLHHRTVRSCADAGFELLDEVVAVLGRVVADEAVPRIVAHASFWRRLAAVRLREQGWPITLGQAEHVLVFRKPDGRESQERPSGRPCRPTVRRKPAGALGSGAERGTYPEPTAAGAPAQAPWLACNDS